MLVNGLLVFFNGIKDALLRRCRRPEAGKSQPPEGIPIYETMRNASPSRLKIFAGGSALPRLGSSMVGSLGYYRHGLLRVAGGDTKSGNNWNGVMGAQAWMIGGFIGPPVL